jgi:hypothetical protein
MDPVRGGVNDRALQLRCLGWVKVSELSTSICLPLCPQTQTLLDAAGTSHLCQERSFIRHVPLNVRPSKNTIPKALQ